MSEGEVEIPNSTPREMLFGMKAIASDERKHQKQNLKIWVVLGIVEDCMSRPKLEMIR